MSRVYNSRLPRALREKTAWGRGDQSPRTSASRGRTSSSNGGIEHGFSRDGDALVRAITRGGRVEFDRIGGDEAELIGMAARPARAELGRIS
jgi:hypothetical protein